MSMSENFLYFIIVQGESKNKKNKLHFTVHPIEDENFFFCTC